MLRDSCLCKNTPVTTGKWTTNRKEEGKCRCVLGGENYKWACIKGGGDEKMKNRAIIPGKGTLEVPSNDPHTYSI